MLRFILCIGVCASAVLGAAPPALAQLGQASSGATAEYTIDLVIPYTVSASNSGPGAIFADTGYASANTGVTPSASAFAKASAPGGYGVTSEADSSANVSYYFEVFGPGDEALVNISVAGSASVYAYSYNYVKSTVQVFTPLGNGIAWEWFDEASYSGGGNRSHVWDFTGKLYTNTVYSINETASVVALINDSGSASGAAWIDPEISILDPGYTLELSPGVGNAMGNPPAIPEPATWAMMILGMGAIGVTMRRTRRCGGAAIATA